MMPLKGINQTYKAFPTIRNFIGLQPWIRSSIKIYFASISLFKVSSSKENKEDKRATAHLFKRGCNLISGSAESNYPSLMASFTRLVFLIFIHSILTWVANRRRDLKLILPSKNMLKSSTISISIFRRKNVHGGAPRCVY